MDQVRTDGRRPRRPRAVSVVVAVGAVVAALVVAAVLVGPDLFGAGRRSSADPSPSASGSGAAPVDPRLPTADDLLGADQVRLGADDSWRVTRTDATVSPRGAGSVCRRGRAADPDGLAAVVRTFEAVGSPSDGLAQTVEVSHSAAHAAQAFRTLQHWYAGCRAARLQLLDAYRVDGVGDRAMVLSLRIWGRPVTTLSVAFANTRAVTTTVVGTTVGRPAPGPRQVTDVLATAVRRLCPRSGAPACVRGPSHHAVPPPGAGADRGVLTVTDLPPVGDVDKPWVETRPVRLRSDGAASTCDRADYLRSGATRASTRTYLIPGASLPVRFGLSATYADFPTERAAARFVAGVRAAVAACEHRHLAARVGPQRRPSPRSSHADASAWDLTIEVSSTRTVRFRLGVVRSGRFVTHLTFAPSDTEDMSTAGFDSLLLRAADRLGERSDR